jgi:ribonuclease J
VELGAGDTVVLSSRVIPGNEDAVARLLQRLRDRAVQVIEDDVPTRALHASGHPAQEELRTMYRWVRPRIAVPVHGEAEHLTAHAELARDCGVPRQLLGRNGDLFMLAPVAGIRRAAAAVGRLQLSEQGLERVTAPAADGAA